MKEPVQRYRRQRLEPEIAAMSVEIDEDDGENPTLIVNIEDPLAKKAIKKVIVWIGSIGGAVEWWRQSTQRQIVLAVVSTAAVTTTASAVVDRFQEGQLATPPAAAQQVVAVHPPVTITLTPAPTKARPSAAPTRSRPEAGKPVVGTPAFLPERSTFAEPAPVRTRTSSPTRTTAPTRKPSPKTSVKASPTVKATQADDSPSAVSRGGPKPTKSTASTKAAQPTAQPTTPPKQTAKPDPPASTPTSPPSKNCGIRVNVNPLLDVCLL